MTEAMEAHEDDELPGEEIEETAEDAVPEDAGKALATSSDPLALSDTEDLAARHGVTVVLVAGEVGTGKTTLLVALWNRMLVDGAIGDVEFAGSRTSLAFERRAWRSRFLSRGEKPDTERTSHQDSGFLHLRLAVDRTLREILISDIAGETFERVRQGADFDSEIDWLERAAVALVLVDGEAIESNRRRSTELQNARRLMLKLREVVHGRVLRTAVVLTKADCLQAARADWVREEAVLMGLAKQIDSEARLFETAARPQDGSTPVGLDGLLEWLLETPGSVAAVSGDSDRAVRMMGRA